MEATINMPLFIKKIFYRIINKSPASMPMVSYWKTKESVQAKLTKADDGSTVMYMEGEKYPFPGYPRGYLLFGSLSPLKHEIKNQIFNESWRKLEEGVSHEEIIRDIKKTLFVDIAEIAEKSKYDMVPPQAMCPAVREIHRAWTKVAPKSTYPLRDYLCFILQEDDGYRFRVQWIVKFFSWFDSPVTVFERSLKMLEHAEVIGDMKERIRLLRRILLLVLEDQKIRELFNAFFKEVDWNKVKLSAGDKYHFRGKYFKVDFPEIEY